MDANNQSFHFDETGRPLLTSQLVADIYDYRGFTTTLDQVGLSRRDIRVGSVDRARAAWVRLALPRMMSYAITMRHHGRRLGLAMAFSDMLSLYMQRNTDYAAIQQDLTQTYTLIVDVIPQLCVDLAVHLGYRGDMLDVFNDVTTYPIEVTSSVRDRTNYTVQWEYWTGRRVERFAEELEFYLAAYRSLLYVIEEVNSSLKSPLSTLPAALPIMYGNIKPKLFQQARQLLKLPYYYVKTTSSGHVDLGEYKVVAFDSDPRYGKLNPGEHVVLPGGYHLVNCDGVPMEIHPGVDPRPKLPARLLNLKIS